MSPASGSSAQFVPTPTRYVAVGDPSGSTKERSRVVAIDLAAQEAVPGDVARPEADRVVARAVVAIDAVEDVGTPRTAVRPGQSAVLSRPAARRVGRPSSTGVRMFPLSKSCTTVFCCVLPSAEDAAIATPRDEHGRDRRDERSSAVRPGRSRWAPRARRAVAAASGRAAGWRRRAGDTRATRASGAARTSRTRSTRAARSPSRRGTRRASPRGGLRPRPAGRVRPRATRRTAPTARAAGSRRTRGAGPSGRASARSRGRGSG